MEKGVDELIVPCVNLRVSGKLMPRGRDLSPGLGELEAGKNESGFFSVHMAQAYR